MKRKIDEVDLDPKEEKNQQVKKRKLDRISARYQQPKYTFEARLKPRGLGKMPQANRDFFHACASGDVNRVRSLLDQDPSLVSYVFDEDARHSTMSVLYYVLELFPLLDPFDKITVPAYLLAYVCSEGNLTAEGRPIEGTVTQQGLEKAYSLIEQAYIISIHYLGAQDRTTTDFFDDKAELKEPKKLKMPAVWVLQQLGTMPQFCETILGVDKSALPARPSEVPSAIPGFVSRTPDCKNYITRAEARGFDSRARTKDGKSALYFACQTPDLNRSTGLFILSFIDDNGFADLYLALEQNDSVVLSNLAALGITKERTINARGENVIHKACQWGNGPLFTALVGQGPSPFQRDHEGNTPHTVAVNCGFQEAITYYHSWMSNLAPRGSASTAASGVLQQAVLLSTLETNGFEYSATLGVARLLAAGYSPFTPDTRGDTSFDLACIYGNNMVFDSIIRACRAYEPDSPDFALFEEALVRVIVNVPLQHRDFLYGRLKSAGILEEIVKNHAMFDKIAQDNPRCLESLVLSCIHEDKRTTFQKNAWFYKHPRVAYYLVQCDSTHILFAPILKDRKFIKFAFFAAMERDDCEMMFSLSERLYRINYWTIQYISLLKVAEQGSLLGLGFLISLILRKDKMHLVAELNGVVKCLKDKGSEAGINLVRTLTQSSPPLVAVIAANFEASELNNFIPSEESKGIQSRVKDVLDRHFPVEVEVEDEDDDQPDNDASEPMDIQSGGAQPLARPLCAPVAEDEDESDSEPMYAVVNGLGLFSIFCSSKDKAEQVTHSQGYSSGT